MRFEKNIKGSAWRSFAAVGQTYARAETPAGVLVLHRGPAESGTAAAAIEGQETWKIRHDGEISTILYDTGSPGVLARRRVKQGIHGTFDGASLTLVGRGSFFPKSRAVSWEHETGSLTFVARRFQIRLVDSAGKQIAAKNAGKWEVEEGATQAQLIAICVFEWSEFDSLLEFPLLALF
ncbi:hypothetical protein ACIA8O_13490 [Kitasatospora sp. NPDC051853]|uniref:hypothetical protein n=1 Tax=Kitasatospora sp. NPDC051853 TaxID=3364058 RepID=UPI00378B0F1E